MRWYKCFTKTFAPDVFSFLYGTGRACLRRLFTNAVSCVSDWRFPVISAALLFSKQREGDVKLDNGWFHIWPPQLPHIRPSSVVLHLVTVCIRCAINPLYLSSSHTRNREKLQIGSHFWSSLQAGLGCPQFGATKANWNLFLSAWKQGVSWAPRVTLGNSHIIFRI